MTLMDAIYRARLAVHRDSPHDEPAAIVAGAGFRAALIRETEAQIEASRPTYLKGISPETMARLENLWERRRDEQMRLLALIDSGDGTIFGLPVVWEPARPDSVVRTRAGREYRIEIAEEVEAGTR
jgi:hypothetical protein